MSVRIVGVKVLVVEDCGKLLLEVAVTVNCDGESVKGKKQGRVRDCSGVTWMVMASESVKGKGAARFREEKSHVTTIESHDLDY